MESKILAVVERNGITESCHRGWVAVCNSEGKIITGTHTSFPSIFVRSSLKPVQALPFILSGGIEKYNINMEELALILSSHSGEDVHTSTVNNIMTKFGITESQLKCGSHTPYSETASKQLIREGKEPQPVHCNCSGKHAGMLAACLMNGWDTESYYDYSHPLQQEIRRYLSEITGIKADELQYGIDGCGVPTYSMTLDKLAFLYAKMADPSGLDENYKKAFEKITEAFSAFPYLIAGENRVDTIIMEAGKGLFISKIGGEAVLGVSFTNDKIGLALKIEDGANRPVIPVLIGCIESLGYKLDEFPALKKLKTSPVFNNLQEQVGLIRPEVLFY